jgi:hypothetical protein
MLEYRRDFYFNVIAHHLTSPRMERLKVFEEECQGLFALLDLSPPTGGVTTTVQDDGSALLPPPNTSLESSGSGDVVRDGQLIPESTATEEESKESQKTGSDLRGPTPQPAEHPRRWYHVLFSCVT